MDINKKQIKIGVFLILLTLSIGMLWIILKPGQEEYSGDNQLEVKISQLPDTIEVTSTPDEIQSKNKFVDEKMGISFNYPKTWSPKTTSDEDCNPKREGSSLGSRSLCIDIYSEDGSSFIKIKINSLNKSDLGGALLTGKVQNKAKVIKVGSNFLLRPNYINAAEDYQDKKNIEVLFIKDLYDQPIASEYGLTYYGEYSVWLIRKNVGYTITYLINPSEIQNERDLSGNKVIETMDQILSTLEIEFKDNIF